MIYQQQCNNRRLLDHDDILGKIAWWNRSKCTASRTHVQCIDARIVHVKKIWNKFAQDKNPLWHDCLFGSMNRIDKEFHFQSSSAFSFFFFCSFSFHFTLCCRSHYQPDRIANIHKVCDAWWMLMYSKAFVSNAVCILWLLITRMMLLLLLLLCFRKDARCRILFHTIRKQNK